jgi:hypothetical protein
MVYVTTTSRCRIVVLVFLLTVYNYTQDRHTHLPMTYSNFLRAQCAIWKRLVHDPLHCVNGSSTLVTCFDWGTWCAFLQPWEMVGWKDRRNNVEFIDLAPHNFALVHCCGDRITNSLAEEAKGGRGGCWVACFTSFLLFWYVLWVRTQRTLAVFLL